MYKEKQDVTIDRTLWVDRIRAEHDSAVKDKVQAVDKIVLPTHRNGGMYDVEKYLMSKKI